MKSDRRDDSLLYIKYLFSWGNKEKLISISLKLSTFFVEKKPSFLPRWDTCTFILERRDLTLCNASSRCYQIMESHDTCVEHTPDVFYMYMFYVVLDHFTALCLLYTLKNDL